jgi:YHS domain-containing protein
LAQLSGLKELKRVYLWQTKVTDAGVGNLKKAVPNLYVNRGEELAIVAAPPPAEAKPADAKATSAAKPVNTVCPVSGKPVDVTKALTHEGKVIGFCCDMCPKAFAKEPAKFLTKLQVAEVKPAEKKPEEKKPEEKKPEPAKPQAAVAAQTPAPAPAPAPAAQAGGFGKTANSKCPLSGKAVDAEFVVALDGKAVGFCCGSCKEKFTSNPAAHVGKIKFDAGGAGAGEKKTEAKDSEPAKPQAAAASATPVNAKCPVSDQDVKPNFTSTLDGKTVGFCCDKCLAKFAKEPQKYAAKIAAAK